MITLSEKKFRAWSNKFDGMIYPNEEYTIDVAANTVWKDARDDEGCSIMQYTCLNDEDGKEVYEADILGNGKTAYVVEWCECGFLAHNDGAVSDLDLVLGMGFKVIGNTFETPEKITLTPEE